MTTLVAKNKTRATKQINMELFKVEDSGAHVFEIHRGFPAIALFCESMEEPEN